MIEWKTTDEIPRRNNAVFIIERSFDNKKLFIEEYIFIEIRDNHWVMEIITRPHSYLHYKASEICAWIYKYEVNDHLLQTYKKIKWCP